jgi:transcriptional regulator with XRE-family HTH domain
MRRKGQKEPDVSTVGGRVKSARLARGWTMEELASKVGVSKGLIAQWEDNKIKDFKASNLFRLSDVLDCNTRWLLYAKDNSGRDLPMGKPRHLTPDAAQLVDTFDQLPAQAREELLDDAQKYLRLTAPHNSPKSGPTGQPQKPRKQSQ